MLSKRSCRARIALALLLIAGCRSTVTRLVERPNERTETNASFVVEDNLLRLHTITIDGRGGRFLIGSAHPHTVVSPAFAGARPGRRARIQLGPNHAVEVEPIVTDLHGTGEAIVGFDAAGGRAMTINYVAGLITWHDSGSSGGGMTVYRYLDVPQITVTVDGREVPAIVDTTSPDTLTLPRGSSPAARARARVEIAGTAFPNTDIAFADVSRPRIGNRLLSKFLVTIDYGRQQVLLWRERRVPIE